MGKTNRKHEKTTAAAAAAAVAAAEHPTDYWHSALTHTTKKPT